MGELSTRDHKLLTCTLGLANSLFLKIVPLKCILSDGYEAVIMPGLMLVAGGAITLFWVGQQQNYIVSFVFYYIATPHDADMLTSNKQPWK